MGCFSCNNGDDPALLSGTMSKSYNNEYEAPYQVSRMLRGSHAILPYQSATHGSTTFLLLPRNHCVTESASQVIRWAWRSPDSSITYWTEVGKVR